MANRVVRGATFARINASPAEDAGGHDDLGDEDDNGSQLIRSIFFCVE